MRRLRRCGATAWWLKKDVSPRCEERIKELIDKQDKREMCRNMDPVDNDPEEISLAARDALLEALEDDPEFQALAAEEEIDAFDLALFATDMEYGSDVINELCMLRN